MLLLYIKSLIISVFESILSSYFFQNPTSKNRVYWQNVVKNISVVLGFPQPSQSSQHILFAIISFFYTFIWGRLHNTFVVFKTENEIIVVSYYCLHCTYWLLVTFFDLKPYIFFWVLVNFQPVNVFMF